MVPSWNRPDVALEAERTEHGEEGRIHVCERGEAAEPLDLLGRERQRQQVAEGLLEPGEDEISPMGRKPADEKLERGPFLGHPRGQVARHHGELVQVGDRSQRSPIGPERDGRLGVHRGGLLSSRAKQPERSVDRVGPAGPGRPRIDIQQRRQIQLRRILVNELPAAEELLGRRLQIPLLPQLGHVHEGPDLGVSRRHEPVQVRLDLGRNPAAQVERDRRTNQAVASPECRPGGPRGLA